jgi:hypothetical protein
VTTSTARRARRGARRSTRRTAASPAVLALARIGLAARGLLYVVIGWLALEIAFGHARQQADRTGALHAIAATRIGGILLWILVIGFAGLALWRLAEAAYGTPGKNGGSAASRLAALGRALIYAVTAYGTLRYALGKGAPQSSDQQAVDLTADFMRHPGGQVLVAVIGVALIAGGGYVAWQAWRHEFADTLATGRMRPGTRRIVERIGVAGGIARGVVFATAGMFLVVAAVHAQPGQAKGVDSSLRALAATPFGPWLLALVAVGLVLFGVFSCCQARWFRS